MNFQKIDLMCDLHCLQVVLVVTTKSVHVMYFTVQYMTATWLILRFHISPCTSSVSVMSVYYSTDRRNYWATVKRQFDKDLHSF